MQPPQTPSRVAEGVVINSRPCAHDVTVSAVQASVVPSSGWKRPFGHGEHKPSLDADGGVVTAASGQGTEVLDERRAE